MGGARWVLKVGESGVKWGAAVDKWNFETVEKCRSYRAKEGGRRDVSRNLHSEA